VKDDCGLVPEPNLPAPIHKIGASNQHYQTTR
jgi:hypothetical protein